MVHLRQRRRVLRRTGGDPVSPSPRDDDGCRARGAGRAAKHRDVYRGADRGVNEEGLCWSLHRSVAERFPFARYLRYRAERPVLVTATVRKAHIIAVKFDREEAEVLTWVARVRSVRPLPAGESLTGPASRRASEKQT